MRIRYIVKGFYSLSGFVSKVKTAVSQGKLSVEESEIVNAHNKLVHSRESREVFPWEVNKLFPDRGFTDKYIRETITKAQGLELLMVEKPLPKKEMKQQSQSALEEEGWVKPGPGPKRKVTINPKVTKKRNTFDGNASKAKDSMMDKQLDMPGSHATNYLWFGVEDLRTSPICRSIKRMVHKIGKGKGVNRVQLDQILREISRDTMGPNWTMSPWHPHPYCRHVPSPLPMGYRTRVDGTTYRIDN